MANINETAHWTEHIYEIATTDDVIGGKNGISNRQAVQLASRTNFLKTRVTGLENNVRQAQELASYANLPAGTRLPFAQPAAPTGWTQLTDDTADNRMLRVVNSQGGGSGGTVGGVHSPVINNVVAAHTHSFTTGNISADHSHVIHDPGHTHGVSDPGHAHELRVSNINTGGSANGEGNGHTNRGIAGGSASGIQMAATGIALHHATTGIWAGGVTSNHTHSGATDNGSSQTSWQPRYIDLIICVKD